MPCDAYAELIELEAEEDNRIRQDPEIAILEDLETDENSEWLRACGWVSWFKHKLIPLLVMGTTVPAPGCPSARRLGNWHDIECSSPSTVERTLQLLSLASQAVIERCVKTLRHTRRVLGCWT